MAAITGYWRVINGKKVWVKGYSRDGGKSKAGFSKIVKSQAEREVARKILREGGIMQKKKEDIVEKPSTVSTSGGGMRGGKKGKSGSRTVYKGKKAKPSVKRK